MSCDHPKQLLMVPKSLTFLGVLGIEWSPPPEADFTNNSGKDSDINNDVTEDLFGFGTPQPESRMGSVWSTPPSIVHKKQTHQHLPTPKVTPLPLSDLSSYMLQVRSAALVLKRCWMSSLSHGERGMCLRSAPTHLPALMSALSPLFAPHLLNLQVAGTQVSCPPLSVSRHCLEKYSDWV